MFDPEKDENLGTLPAKRDEIGANASLEDAERMRPTSDDAERAMRGAEKMNGNTRNFNLDGAEAVAVHSRLMAHFTHEMDVQSSNRVEMAADEDMFDHIQYTDEELAALERRGQSPIVYNLVQTTVNWVTGTQRRSPMDYKILPRRKEGTAAAEMKTDVLKHIGDTNRTEYEVSRAFASAVKAGIGWLETGQGLPHEGTKVFERSESWRYMLWDSTAMRYDLNDARYEFRAKWLDADVAAAMWSGRKGLVKQSVNGTILGMYGADDIGDESMDSLEAAHMDVMSGQSHRGWAHYTRERVRVMEAWFRRPVQKAPFMRGGQFHGELFDQYSMGHISELNSGRATISAQPAEVMFVALMTERGLLYLGRSPFRHGRYPFTPIWGYRRERDGMPYGLIRGVRDIQRSFNRQKAKALHHLSATRTFVEKGSVDDLDELADEVGRPDAQIVYNKGYNPPRVEDGRVLAAAHLEMASQDASLLQATGGVTDENMGRKSNATSGIAIERRQDQGALATSQFFDNLRHSRIIHGEKTLVLSEQFYDEKDVIRVTDTRGKPKWLNLDPNSPDAIGSHKADFIVTEEEWRATIRQANASALLDLAGKLAPVAPEMVIGMLDIVVEAMDVPHKQELVQRIRKMNGAEDPDADPDNPDPETQARKAMEEVMAKLQMALADAELKEKQGKARKITAEAINAEKKVGSDAITKLKNAFEAALQIAGAPAVAAAADQVLTLAMQEEAAALAGQAPAEAAPFVDPMAAADPMAAQPQPQPGPPMPPGAAPTPI